MTDPMEALYKLQSALDAGDVRMQRCELHTELKVLLDNPAGMPRYTYALIKNKQVVAIAMFVITDPVKGVTCFQIGYAVIEKMRGQGIGTAVLSHAIEEIQHGFSRTPAREFYIEAVVSIENAPSNKIARKLISDSQKSITDAFSGDQAFQYLRKIQMGA